MQVASASIAGAVTMSGGLAAANALPGAAQSVASDVLSHVGISVPSPDDHAGAHPDLRGRSDPHPAHAASSPTNTPPDSTHGSDVSAVARDTTTTGADHGAAVSDVANDGDSQAGTNDANTAPVGVPNDGGTGTAGTASDGHSTPGTTNAGTNSDGHSTAGSQNTDSGLSNRP